MCRCLGAGKPTRDKDTPGREVNGHKSREKWRVGKGTFPGLSAGAGGKMSDVLSNPLRSQTKPSPPVGDIEDRVQKP